MQLHEIKYDKSLVSLANSALKAFGAPRFHATLKCADEILEKSHKNKVILLLDGMGVSSLEYHLPETSFLRRNHAETISSTFPPTTTAATVSLMTGLTPAEHGWLGWNMYFPEEAAVASMFRNTVKNTNDQAAPRSLAWSRMPYTGVTAHIKSAGGQAYTVSPFEGVTAGTLDGILQAVLSLCETPGRKYIYAYWTEPDSTMHEYGCKSGEANSVLQGIDAQIEEFAGKLRDTALFMTADHGHVDVDYSYICDCPDLFSMLKGPSSLEPRACMFFVKEGMLCDFKRVFDENYGDSFDLLSVSDALAMKLFGGGELNAYVKTCLGDYIAIAKGGACLADTRADTVFKSHHAGLTPDEMDVPLIVALS